MIQNTINNRVHVSNLYLEIFVFLFFLMGILSCKNKEDGEDKTHKKDLETLNELYSEYLKSNVNDARDSMIRSVEILANSETIDRRIKAHSLWLTYGRLFCIELHSGDEDASYLAFVKAQYWHLRKFEGKGVKESARRLRAETKEKLKETILMFDKENNNGSVPFYVLGDQPDQSKRLRGTDRTDVGTSK